MNPHLGMAQAISVQGGAGADSGSTGSAATSSGPTGATYTQGAASGKNGGEAQATITATTIGTSANAITVEGGGGGSETTTGAAGKGGNASLKGDAKSIVGAAVTIRGGRGGNAKSGGTAADLGGAGGDVTVDLKGTGSVAGNITGTSITIGGNTGGNASTPAVGGKAGSTTVIAGNLTSTSGSINIYNGQASGADVTVTLTGKIISQGSLTINSRSSTNSSASGNDGKITVTATELISNTYITIRTANAAASGNGGDVILNGVSNIQSLDGSVTLQAYNGNNSTANTPGNVIANDVVTIKANDSVTIATGNGMALSAGGSVQLNSLESIENIYAADLAFEVTIKTGNSGAYNSGSLSLPNLKEIRTLTEDGEYGDVWIQTGRASTVTANGTGGRSASLDLSSLEVLEAGALHLCAAVDYIAGLGTVGGSLIVGNENLVVDVYGGSDAFYASTGSYLRAGQTSNPSTTEGQAILIADKITFHAMGLTVWGGDSSGSVVGAEAILQAKEIEMKDTNPSYGYLALQGGNAPANGDVGGNASVVVETLRVSNYISLYGGDNADNGTGGGTASLTVTDSLYFGGNLSINYESKDAAGIVNVKNYYVTGNGSWNLNYINPTNFTVENLIIDAGAYPGSKLTINAVGIVVTPLAFSALSLSPESIITLPNVILRNGGVFDGGPETLGVDYYIETLTLEGQNNILSNVVIDYTNDNTHPGQIIFDLSTVASVDDPITLLNLENSTIKFAPDQTFAEAGIVFDNWQDLDFKPGQTFTIFGADANTTLENLPTGALVLNDSLEGYLFSVGEDGSITMVAQTSPTTSTKPFFEAAAAALLTVAEAAIGLESTIANLAQSLAADQIQIKLGFLAESLTNDSGSEVHTKLWGLSLVGGAKNSTRVGELTYGAFLEAGTGNYDTLNSSEVFGSLNGEGDSDYFGGGFFLRHDFYQGTWLSLSARLGNVRNDYKVLILEGLDFTSSSSYFGANLGLGHKYSVTESVILDLYVRGSFTHVTGETVYDHAGGTILFDATDSFRSRLGGRLNVNFNKSVSAYFGVAWEHEFYGDAGGKYVNANGIVSVPESPSLGGSSAFGELGLLVRAAKNFALEFTAFGLLGQSKGGGATASLVFSF
jgi:hypothetical protein